MNRELRNVQTAARRRAEADVLLRERIRAAHATGASLRAIATVAGVSHVQVLRVVRGGDR